MTTSNQVELREAAEKSAKALWAGVRNALRNKEPTVTFNIHTVSRAGTVLDTLATIRDTDEDADVGSIKTWIAGLPHDLESRPLVLADLDRIANRLAPSTPAEPDEPTEAMIEAGYEQLFTLPGYPDQTKASLARAYKAMSRRKAEPDAKGGEA